MSNETQNKFTPDEEQMISRLSDILKKDRERAIIEKTVKEKIAASGLYVRKPFLNTTGGRIITVAGLAAAAVLAFFFFNFKPQDSLTPNDNTSHISADTEFITQWDKTDTPQEVKKEKPKVKKRRRRRVKRETGAVPGMPIASNNNSMPAIEKQIQEFSFTANYKFNKKANIRRFRKDLKNALEKLGVKFNNRSNREEVVHLVSIKSESVDEQNRPVKFYIVANVNKRFPGNLNMSLRYYPLDSGTTAGGTKSINTIFYTNLKARVSALIDWKYKPQSEKE